MLAQRQRCQGYPQSSATRALDMPGLPNVTPSNAAACTRWNRCKPTWVTTYLVAHFLDSRVLRSTMALSMQKYVLSHESSLELVDSFGRPVLISMRDLQLEGAGRKICSSTLVSNEMRVWSCEAVHIIICNSLWWPY